MSVTIDRRRRRPGRASGTPGESSGQAIAWLYRSLFQVDDAAAIASPHSFSPGPGAFAVTGSDQAIADGIVNCPNNAGNQGFLSSNSYALAAARAYIWKRHRLKATPSATGMSLGLVGSAAISLTLRAGFYFNNAALFSDVNNATGITIDALPTTDADYDYAVVQRAVGCFLLQRPSGTLPWRLLYIDNTNTTTPLWPQERYTSSSHQFGEWLGFDGWTISPVASFASGAVGTVTMPIADVFGLLTCTGTAAQSIKFRIQDATNFWEAERTATALRLIQTIDGVQQAAAATTGITATANERILVRNEGNVMRAWRYLSTAGTPATVTATSAAFAASSSMGVKDEANYANFEAYTVAQTGPLV
jgi:hypothetical protein